MHKHEHQSINWIWTAFFLNLIFAAIEFIGGALTNSIAIISDSIHDLWDSLAIWLAYIFEKVSKKKANEKYSYWYARYSILWALITVLILVIWSFLIMKHAIERFSEPKEINLTNYKRICSTKNRKRKMNERKSYHFTSIRRCTLTSCSFNWSYSDLFLSPEFYRFYFIYLHLRFHFI